MTSWFERALIKVIAPDATKKLALNARLKLLDLSEGTPVWFTPQEIEAVEADRHEVKRTCLQSVVVGLALLGLWGWALDFSPSWMVIFPAAAVLSIAMDIAAWRKINAELDTMQTHLTRAHRSFFKEPE